jgi:UDP-glucose 4-epimerase
LAAFARNSIEIVEHVMALAAVSLGRDEIATWNLGTGRGHSVLA